MPWEARTKNAKYFYTAKRVGGRVVKTYWGHGSFGRAAEHAEALRRGAREAEKASLARERAALEEAIGLSRALAELCALLAEATLLAGGFHRQGRHPWRRWHAGRRTADGQA